MSEDRRPDSEEARRLLEAWRDSQIPDPGEAYWAAFPGRVRRALGKRRAPRPVWTAWPAWGGLAAAAVLVLLVWARTDLLRAPEPGTGPLATAEPVATSWTAGPGPGRETPPSPSGETDAATGWPAAVEGELEGALDALLGQPGPFDLARQVRRLTPEQREALLESLRAELEGAPASDAEAQDPA
jgi:hypothetical protein